jgi:hypothetical protein
LAALELTFYRLGETREIIEVDLVPSFRHDDPRLGKPSLGLCFPCVIFKVRGQLKTETGHGELHFWITSHKPCRFTI